MNVNLTWTKIKYSALILVLRLTKFVVSLCSTRFYNNSKIFWIFLHVYLLLSGCSTDYKRLQFQHRLIFHFQRSFTSIALSFTTFTIFLIRSRKIFLISCYIIWSLFWSSHLLHHHFMFVTYKTKFLACVMLPIISYLAFFKIC